MIKQVVQVHSSVTTINSSGLKPRMVKKKQALTVAGVVLSVETLPTGLHTLALMQEEPTRTQGALGYRGSPAGGAGAVAG